ncbi:MAG: 1-phosphofructokinase family hexose kinase [Phycisphaerales bacterium]
MPAQTPIVTVTLNPAVDVSTSTPAMVSQKKLRCERPVREPGGGGINIARGVRELGGEATAVFTAGGVSGARLRDLVESSGVDAVAVEIADETRENIAVEDRATNALYRFVFPGPTLSEAEVERVAETVRDRLRGRGSGAILAISGSMCPGVPEGVFERVWHNAREKGVRVLADVSGEWLTRAADAGVSFVKPNVSELEAFAGSSLESDRDVLEAARSLRARGVSETVFVSLGAGGLLCVSADGVVRLSAPLVRVRSTIGAGDSTVAGIALALARGASVDEAARLGVAAGTAACLTEGTALCRRADVERLSGMIGYSEPPDDA